MKRKWFLCITVMVFTLFTVTFGCTKEQYNINADITAQGSDMPQYENIISETSQDMLTVEFSIPELSQEEMELYLIDDSIYNATIDIDLNWAIPPQFDRALSFSEGLAAVEKDGLWGYIDKTGQVVIPFQFDYAGDFSEGLAVVWNRDYLFGFIDQTGDLVIPYQFEKAGAFSEGLAPILVTQDITQNRVLCYIDKRGEIQLYTNYIIDVYAAEDAQFHNGIAQFYCYSEDDQIPYIDLYIDRNGKPICSFKENINANPFYNGIALVYDSDSDIYYYINTEFETIITIDDSYYDASRFNNGLARLRDEYVKYIDDTGKEVIQLEKDVSGYYFSDDGIAQVEKPYLYKASEDKNEWWLMVPAKYKWSYIDKTGKYLLPYIYYGYAFGFDEGLAACLIPNYGYGYIRSPLALNIVLNNNKLEFNTTLQLSGGMVLAPLEELCGYLDMNINIDTETKKLVITKDNLKIIGMIDSGTIMADGAEKEYSVPVTTLFGITYVPVDMLTDAIQADTVWDADNSTFTIDTK